MKILHIADLHFGKSIHGVSMIDNLDQVVWVERFIEKVDQVQPDVVVIAGDVYDRSAPNGDAVALFDHMLTALESREITVLVVAGNHDSGQRLSFAGDILAKQKIHISGKLHKKLDKIDIKDAYGTVHFWLMPYVFPALVADLYADDSINDYDSAVRKILKEQDIAYHERNILVAHQNVVQSGKAVELGGSESMVGGVGQIDYTAFDGFTYVALGHIHAAYPVGRRAIRYAGSPLCYHFDELKQVKKGPVLITLGEAGTEPEIETLLIEPLHQMRELKGDWETVKKELEQASFDHAYIKVVLTDCRIKPEISDFIKNICGLRDSIAMEIVSEYREFVPHLGEGGLQREKKAVEDYFLEMYKARNDEKEPDELDLELFHFIGECIRNRKETQEQQEQEKKDALDMISFMEKQEV